MRDSKKDTGSAAESNLRTLDFSRRSMNPVASLGRLEKDLQQLQAKWRNVELQMADRDSQIKSLESEKEDLASQVQSLQNRFDRKKTESKDLKASLLDYRNTIEGMSGDLKGHDKVVATIESEKAALALQVMELERDLAEWKGRYTEKKELLKKTRKELKSRDDSAVMDELAKEKETIVRLEAQIANLEDAVAQQKELELQLRDEISQGAAKVDEANDKAAEFEIKAAELQAVLLEAESDKKSIELELEAQCDLVHVLEKELSSKQENLDILERSADRLSAIRSGIQDLDVEIDDLWTKPQESVSELHEEILLQPEELLDLQDTEASEHTLVLDGAVHGDSESYPLTSKNMTIGRSSRSDICLNSKYISRIHANIRIRRGKVTVEDAGSMNGFLVNSKQRRKHTLSNGDELEFGRVKLRYVHRELAAHG